MTLEDCVRHIVLIGGPQLCDETERERYIDTTINAMTKVEFTALLSQAYDDLRKLGSKQ